MRSTQAKKLKARAIKGGAKRIGAKLPRYKARDRRIQGRRKFSLGPATMNRSGARIKSVRNGTATEDSLSETQLVSQHNLKRRRKKYATSGGSQRSADFSVWSTADSPETRHGEDGKDAEGRERPERRNIGSPVIVEALSENLSSLSIPEVFKQERTARRGNRASDGGSSNRGRSMDPSTDAARATGAEPSESSGELATTSGSPSPRKGKRGGPRKDERATRTKSSENQEGSEARDSPETGNGKDSQARAVPLAENGPSTERAPIRLYSLRNKVVAVMPAKARLCFTGKLVVRAIHGAVEAYGTVVTTENGPVEIYSPRGYSNVSIETSDKYSSTDATNAWASLNAEGVYREEESKLVAEIERIEPGTAVLLLSNLENKLTRFLNAFYPFRLFPKLKDSAACCWTDRRRAEAILQANLYMDRDACKELIVDPRIAREVAEKMSDSWRANQWSCTLIAGGKSVGKSTATRYLINSLLPVSKMVVLLDVDPGQSECTPPGCVSFGLIEQPLTGPNFTHMKSPVFQLYIGDTNVSRCITRYIEGIKMLTEKLTSCPILSRLPIVVNTMGFTHGIGWDIILFTIKLVRPSLVVQIMSEKPKNNHIGYLSKQVVNRQALPWPSWSRNVVDWSRACDHELFVVRSHAERKTPPGCDTWNMEPYQQRELALISYLGGILRNSATRYDAAPPSINDTVPYATPFSSLFVSIPGASVPPTHVLNVVNGNVVALCGIDAETEARDTGIESGSGLRVLDRSPLCSCYGFGIVRGVDPQRREIFISSPLSADAMRHVNCLVGCIPVPVPLLQPSRQRSNVPYTGGVEVSPMSREHRRGYFRMRYRKGQNGA